MSNFYLHYQFCNAKRVIFTDVNPYSINKGYYKKLSVDEALEILKGDNDIPFSEEASNEIQRLVK